VLAKERDAEGSQRLNPDNMLDGLKKAGFAV
jgi:hypothetical protein